jgi:TolB protein
VCSSDLIITSGHGGGEDPSWSPDGRLIAYASRTTGRYQIYVMTAAGQPVRRLTDMAGENTDPAWSPRGVVGK